jgi:hypothetical protein
MSGESRKEIDVLKKSGILLVVLALSTFTLAFSASAQTSQAPALQAAQTAVPVPAFLLTLAPQPSAVTPAASTTGLEWLGTDGPGKPACRCTTKAQCGGGACCWWPKQKCGICC